MVVPSYQSQAGKTDCMPPRRVSRKRKKMSKTKIVSTIETFFRTLHVLLYLETENGKEKTLVVCPCDHLHILFSGIQLASWLFSFFGDEKGGAIYAWSSGERRVCK